MTNDTDHCDNCGHSKSLAHDKHGCEYGCECAYTSFDFGLAW